MTLALGIETSCDETSVALVEAVDGTFIVHGSLIASQVQAHAAFGGVVPEIASRKHLEMLNPLLQQLRQETGIAWRDLDVVAVTHGPGLMGALLVGVAAAKTLALVAGIPCQPVNHLEGHILANWLQRPDLPCPMLCLLVSGGHTELVEVQAPGQYRRLGATRDDAVGEAFDKVARVLGLPQPGGPELEQLAAQGADTVLTLPVTQLEPGYDFSYSGLKTAAVQLLTRHPDQRSGIAHAFQASAVAQLQRTVQRALRDAGRNRRVRSLAVAGGVAANRCLRSAMQQIAGENDLEWSAPAAVFCTDNAAMIAAAGLWQWHRAGEPPWQAGMLDFDVHSVLPLAEVAT